MHELFLKVAIEQEIEEFVKENGHLIMLTANSDWDENGNFIGDFSAEFKLAKKYVGKYNPQNLTTEEYRRLYGMGKLPWQKEHSN